MSLWTPASLTNGTIQHWHDAQTLSSITKDASNNVSQWNDRGSLGHNLTQATTAKQPVYTAVNSNFNNKPTLSVPLNGGMSAAADYMPDANQFLMGIDGSSNPVLYSGSTGVVSATYVTPVISGVFAMQWQPNAGLGPSYTASDALLFWGNGTNLGYQLTSGTGAANDAASTASGGLIMVAARVKTLGQSTSYGRFCDKGTVFNRSSDWARTLDADLGEIIIISGATTAADRQLLEGYMAWRWGLQSSLPSTHPYRYAAPLIQSKIGARLSRASAVNLGSEKSMTLISPVANDEVTMFYTPSVLSVASIVASVTGSSPSVTYSVYYNSSRASTATSLVASQTVTSTTGTTISSFSSKYIPAGSFVWVVVSAVSGTVTDFNLTMNI